MQRSLGQVKTYIPSTFQRKLLEFGYVLQLLKPWQTTTPHFLSQSINPLEVATRLQTPATCVEMQTIRLISQMHICIFSYPTPGEFGQKASQCKSPKPFFVISNEVLLHVKTLEVATRLQTEATCVEMQMVRLTCPMHQYNSNPMWIWIKSNSMWIAKILLYDV